MIFVYKRSFNEKKTKEKDLKGNQNNEIMINENSWSHKIGTEEGIIAHEMLNCYQKSNG